MKYFSKFLPSFLFFFFSWKCSPTVFGIENEDNNLENGKIKNS